MAAFWAEHAEAPAASGKPSERAEVAEENESEEAKEEEKEPFERVGVCEYNWVGPSGTGRHRSLGVAI